MRDAKTESVTEAELVELFRRRRPDPEAFRARVAQRIREKEREPDSGSAREPTLLGSELVRRVAAVLPLEPSSGLGFAKLLVTSLALPFVVLSATVAAFVAASRSVLRSTGSAQPASREPRPLQDVVPARDRDLIVGLGIPAWLHPAGVLLLFLPSLTGSPWAVDVVVALVLAAALSLVFLVRGLARSTLLTPATVADHAAAILGALFMGVFLWPLSRRVAAAGSDLGLGWSGGLVLLGIVACALVPRGGTGWSRLGWLCLVPLLVVLNPLGLTRSSPASLRAQLASFEVEAHELRGWQPVGVVAEALLATGAELPPLPSVERALQLELARGPEQHSQRWTAGIDAHPRVWTTAAQVGLMTRERWQRLAERPAEARKLEQLLAHDGPLTLQEYDEYLFPMLLATRTLTAEQRAALAARIEATWPATGSHDPLASALLLVRLLDHLGLQEHVEARRADVQRLLLEHWFARPTRGFLPTGGFTPNPAKFETAVPGSTHAAVVLMARFGVPAGIDLRRVRAYLRAEGAAFWLVIPERSELQSLERAALLRLEHQLAIPPRPWLAALAGERILVACALLVLLCGLAIVCAPRPDPAAGRRALP